MTKHERSEACGYLLTARGWASCWLPIMDDPKSHPDSTVAEHNGMFPTLGHMRGICEAIDAALKLLGHAGNGRVHGTGKKGSKA